MGKFRRLSRILQKDGNSLIVAMDHPGTSGPIPGYINPADTINTMVDGGVDAFLVNIGVCKNFAKELAPKGLIMRVDYPSSDIVSGVYDCELFLEAEQAAALAVDAVILTAGIGEALERKTFKNIATVVRTCDRLGIPVIAEMVPGGFNSAPEMRSLQNLKMSARIACEFGADMIKMPYCRGFEEVVQGSYLPIVVLGGEKTSNEEDFIASIHDAMHCGANGVAIGRNLWGAQKPKAMARALRAIIHEGADAQSAIEIYRTL